VLFDMGFNTGIEFVIFAATVNRNYCEYAGCVVYHVTTSGVMTKA